MRPPGWRGEPKNPPPRLDCHDTSPIVTAVLEMRVLEDLEAEMKSHQREDIAPHVTSYWLLRIDLLRAKHQDAA